MVHGVNVERSRYGLLQDAVATFIGGTSEGTKGLSSQWISPFWFENQTHDHANMKQ